MSATERLLREAPPRLVVRWAGGFRAEPWPDLGPLAGAGVVGITGPAVGVC